MTGIYINVSIQDGSSFIIKYDSNSIINIGGSEICTLDNGECMTQKYSVKRLLKNDKYISIEFNFIKEPNIEIESYDYEKMLCYIINRGICVEYFII